MKQHDVLFKRRCRTCISEPRRKWVQRRSLLQMAADHWGVEAAKESLRAEREQEDLGHQALEADVSTAARNSRFCGQASSNYSPTRGARSPDGDWNDTAFAHQSSEGAHRWQST